MAGNLWNQPGVPHRGWTCINTMDLGDDCGPGEEVPYVSCEMCGNERVRYVHTMSHPDYLEELDVGCVCAAKMSDEYVENVRHREQSLRSKVQAKGRWLQRKWKTSRKGNPMLKIDGHYLTIFPRKFPPGSWGYGIGGDFSKKSYPTQDAAKLALFDAFWNLTGGAYGRNRPPPRPIYGPDFW